MFLTPYVLSVFTSFVTSKLIEFSNLTYESSMFISFIVYVSTLFMFSFVNSTFETFAKPSVSVASVVIVLLIPFIFWFIPNVTFPIGLLFATFTFLIFNVYNPCIPLFGICNVIACVSEFKVAVIVTVVPSFKTTPGSETLLLPSLKIVDTLPVASSFIPVTT